MLTPQRTFIAHIAPKINKPATIKGQHIPYYSNVEMLRTYNHGATLVLQRVFDGKETDVVVNKSEVCSTMKALNNMTLDSFKNDTDFNPDALAGIYEPKSTYKPAATNRAFFTLANDADINEYCVGKDIHEIVQQDRPRCAFFDLDIKKEALVAFMKRPEALMPDAATLVDSILQMTINEVKRLAKDFGYTAQLNEIVSKRHREGKWSFHIVFKSIGFANHRSHVNFYNYLEKNSQFIAALTTDHIFDRLDKTTQGFAVFKSTKTGGFQFVAERGDPQNVTDMMVSECFINGCQLYVFDEKDVSHCDQKLRRIAADTKFDEEDIDQCDKFMRVFKPDIVSSFCRPHAKGSRIHYDRLKPSYCGICNREHESYGSLFLYVNFVTGKLQYGCQRENKKDSTLVDVCAVPEIVAKLKSASGFAADKIGNDVLDIIKDDAIVPLPMSDQKPAKRGPGRPKKQPAGALADGLTPQLTPGEPVQLMNRIRAKYLKERKPVKFDYNDPYSYIEFIDGVQTTNFKTEEALFEYIASNASRVIAKLSSSGFVTKRLSARDDVGGKTLGDLTDAKMLKTKVVIDDDKGKTFCIGELIDNFTLPYDVIRFEPWEYETDKSSIYCYPGLAVQRTDEVVDLTKILNFLKEIWCNGDETTYRYLLKWLQVAMNESQQRTECMIFIYSSETGTGKNTICDFLKIIFGSLAYEICGLAPMIEKHSVLELGRKLVIVDEQKADTSENGAAYDLLKNAITRTVMNVNPKGLSEFQARSFSNFIMTSNNINAIKSDNQERRILYLQCNPKYKGNIQYWNEFRSEVMNKRYAAAFYTYIMGLDLSDIDIRKVPLTELREEVIEVNKPTIEYFLDRIASDYNIPIDWNYNIEPAFLDKLSDEEKKLALNTVEAWRQNKECVLVASEFYKKYLAYCNSLQIRGITGQGKFGSIVKCIFDSKKSGNIIYNITKRLQPVGK